MDDLGAAIGKDLPVLDQIVAALQVDLPERDDDIGGAAIVLGLLGELECLGQIAFAAGAVAQVGVGLADIAELERNARLVAQLLIDLEGALVVGQRLLALAELGEHDAHVVEHARLVAAALEHAVDDERFGVGLD